MLGLLTTILGGWVLDFARLKLTQPSKLSLAKAGAELGNNKREDEGNRLARLKRWILLLRITAYIITQSKKLRCTAEASSTVFVKPPYCQV